MSEKFKTRRQQARRAWLIQESLGTRVAAGYLRNNGWSVEGAIALLAIY